MRTEALKKTAVEAMGMEGAVRLVDLIRRAQEHRPTDEHEFQSGEDKERWNALHNEFLATYPDVERNSYIENSYPGINLYTLRTLMFEGEDIFREMYELAQHVTTKLDGITQLTERDLELRTELVRRGVTDTETRFLRDALLWEKYPRFD